MQSITHSYSEKDIYKVKLYGTNRRGVSHETVGFRAVNSGMGPKAYSKLSTYVGVAPLTVNFDGSYSRSSGGTLEHDWRLGNDPNLKGSSSDSNFSYTYTEPGIKFVDHMVKDSNGNFDMTFRKIWVLNPDDVSEDNVSPTVVLNSSHFHIDGLSVSTSATLSDSDGQILLTEWDWGDRTVDIFRYDKGSTQHQYSESGSYTVTVRVFDNMGAMATATYSLSLSESMDEGSFISFTEEEYPDESQSSSAIYWDPERDNHRNLEREDRVKTGCHTKRDGQIRCYSSKYVEKLGKIYE